MKVQVFKNRTGLIHGNDPKRIGCDRKGVLKIGPTEITVSPIEDSILPALFYGASGDYNAIFTDEDGKVYELDKVAVRGGRIVPPPPVAVEIMELKCRAEVAEEERDALREKIRELEGIFDTNSLNFLIK